MPVDQLVPDPLVVPLGVVMLHVLVDDTLEVNFTERNNAIQALFLDRPHELLRPCCTGRVCSYWNRTQSAFVVL